MIKFKPFPELADILLREQCETFGGHVLAYTQGRRGRVKVDAYEILIYNTDVSYLPLSEMGHTAMLHVN